MANYQEYLKSDHWKKLTEETKRLAGYRCQVCNADGELHTHHRTYERKGDEFQGDLVALCKDCHTLFHGKTEKDRTVQLVMENQVAWSFESLSDMQQKCSKWLAYYKPRNDYTPMFKVSLCVNNDTVLVFDNLPAFSEWATGPIDNSMIEIFGE